MAKILSVLEERFPELKVLPLAIDRTQAEGYRHIDISSIRQNLKEVIYITPKCIASYLTIL